MMDKVLSIAICDDETVALDIISAAVKKVFLSHDVEVRVESFLHPTDLLASLQNNAYSLIFLDINMAGIDGISLGKKMVSEEVESDIVFVSSNNSRVFDTFEVNPFGFVRKDNFIKDISSVIDRYIKQRMTKSDSVLRFELRNRKGLVMINVSLLKYVECLRNEQVFYMDGKDNCSVFLRMKTLEVQLCLFGFIRIHKGYLVNCSYISRFDNSSVTLSSGEKLPVGRSKHAAALEQYLDYIRKNGISIIE